MSNFDKIDKVLEIILNCQTPPRISLVEIIAELKKQKLDISTNELIGILHKLEKDDFIKAEISDSNNICYYFSTFSGRFFRENGGYKHENKRKKQREKVNTLITITTIINIVAMTIFTWMNYRATDKANDNKEELKILNSKIERLTKTNDSLIIITNFKRKLTEKKND